MCVCVCVCVCVSLSLSLSLSRYDPEFVDPKIAIYRIRRKKAV